MYWEIEDFTNIIDHIKSQRFYKTKLAVITTVIVVICILAGYSFVELTKPNISFVHNDEVINISEYNKFDNTVLAQVSQKYTEPYELYDSSMLSIDTIESREGRVIVERCICYVNSFENNNGDGTILNAFDKDYSYIHYQDMGEEIRKGTIVVSYFVYNPNNNTVDDVSDIYDFVLSREYEIETER